MRRFIGWTILLVAWLGGSVLMAWLEEQHPDAPAWMAVLLVVGIEVFMLLPFWFLVLRSWLEGD